MILDSVTPVIVPKGDVKLLFTKQEEGKIRHGVFPQEIDKNNEQISKIGMDHLNFSSSGQFGTSQLKLIKQKISKANPSIPSYIVDVRDSRHGILNDFPFMWKVRVEKDEWVDEEFKEGETTEDVLKDENQRIAQLKHMAQTEKRVKIFERKGAEVDLEVKMISNEEDLVKSEGFSYARFAIHRDQMPTLPCVDNLVKFIVEHPNAWLHFHCYVGGKANEALVLAYMLYNASHVSFDDILAYQKAIGGSDLIKEPKPLSQEDLQSPEKCSVFKEKETKASKRLHFLKDFYLYCQQENPQRNSKAKAWSQWLYESETDSENSQLSKDELQV